MKLKRIWLPILGVAGLTGCAGKEDDKAAATKPVELTARSSPPVMAFAVETTDTNGNVIVLDRVRMTLADIDLERAEDTIDCGEIEDADDVLECSDWIGGPLLLDLNLLGGQSSIGAVQSPLGTFDTVTFDISVPDGGDPEELAYIAANPDMEDVSINIEGAYNGTAFNFVLDLRGDQDIELDPPMEITDASAGFQVLLVFDVSDWFLDAGNLLINPLEVCPVDDSCAERDQIEARIEASIQSYTYEEDDGGGDDDDGGSEL